MPARHVRGPGHTSGTQLDLTTPEAESSARAPGADATLAAAPRPDTTARPAAGERTPAYVWLFTLALPASMLAGNAWRLGLPISPDRVLFAAGLCLLLLTPRAWRGLRLGWPHALGLAALSAVLLSALSAGTLATSSGSFALLDRFLLPFAYFTLAPIVWSTPARRELLLRCLLAMAAYLGLMAILQFVAPGLLVPSYIADPGAGIQAERARGPFLASEPMGLSLLTCGVAATVLAVRRRGLLRLAGSLAATLCAVGVVLTLTRSIWAGAALALIAVAVAQPRARSWILLTLGAALAVGTLVVTSSPTMLASIEDRATASRSLHDRANTNAAALRVLDERPLTGLGWQRFLLDGSDYVRQADTYPITSVTIEVHNVPLGWAAENGIPAAALWLAALAACVVAPMTRRRADDTEGWRVVLLAIGLAWLVASLTSPLPYPTPLLLMWTVAGIVRGGTGHTRPGTGLRPDPRPERIEDRSWNSP